MILTFRPIKVWPDGWQGYKSRASSPFGATHSQTLRLLDRELSFLGATDVTMQVAVSDRDCRLDGQLRADARPSHPGVILTIDTRKHGTLVYATDRFNHWQANLRAIALGLEALRKVERYGIAERGQQYAGYRELPSGIELGRAMTVEEAAAFIVEHSGDPNWIVEVRDDPSFALSLFKDAAKNLHPDVGGDPELFRKLTAARELLEETFGRVA